MNLVLQNKRPQPSSGKLWLWLTQSHVNFTIPIVLCRVLQTWYSQICAVTDDFIWLAIILGTTNIRIHGYIKRQIKQIGTEPKLILIPRIICTFEDKSKRTHNLLPDFVLPYCNYTVKSLASVFSAYIPTQTAIRFKLSDWDRLSTVAFSNRNKQTSSYINQRGSKLFYRYGTISK